MIHTIVDNILLSDGRNITLVTGFFAKQSTGLVRGYMVTLYTILLASVVAYKEVKEDVVKEDVDILPLTVNYRKNYSAVGKIKAGVFIKREGRAVEYEILTMRVVYRILRTLFTIKIFALIQIMRSLLSYDNEIFPNGLAGLSASSALYFLYITFYGTISYSTFSTIKWRKIYYKP